MASIDTLVYPEEIYTIVHTDDPRDDYVYGDIVIRGEVHYPSQGGATYNLYNNRLLQAIPEEGWVHFMDDDDEYISPEAFTHLEKASKNKIHVAKVERWNGQIFPKPWKKKNSFQTECFVLWSTVAKRYRWWADKGGDHNYTRRITRDHAIEWHDKLICKAMNGKGHGRRYDVNEEVLKEPRVSRKSLFPDTVVWYKDFDTMAFPRLEQMPFAEAEVLEKRKKGRATYKGEEVVYGRNYNKNRVS